MKKIFFLIVLPVIFFPECTKKNDQTSINTLYANAGSDTIICMPYGGTGNLFKGELNASASQDVDGKIVSYAWTETNHPSSVISTDETTQVVLSAGLHQFQLKVQDDHNRVAYDIVVIQVLQNFNSEYDGLSWDSTLGGLTTISVKTKPALIQSWPGPFLSIQSDFVYLINYSGTCVDISSWKQLPYVPYDSIQLTSQPVFYSVIHTSNPVNQGTDYPEIFARTNSGIDFSQKVSVGFTNGNPSGAGDWDY